MMRQIKNCSKWNITEKLTEIDTAIYQNGMQENNIEIIQSIQLSNS